MGFVHCIKPAIGNAGFGRARCFLIILKTIDNAGILLFDFLFRTDGPALALSFVAATPRYFSSFHSSFTALRDQPTTTNAALYNRLARPNHRLLPPNDRSVDLKFAPMQGFDNASLPFVLRVRAMIRPFAACLHGEAHLKFFSLVGGF